MTDGTELKSDWTRDHREVVEKAADRVRVDELHEAREALIAVFPQSDVATLRESGHPLFPRFPSEVTQFYALELGLALRATSPDSKLIKRLRSPTQYEGAAAECRAAFMICYRTGASFRPPPTATGRKQCEYIADFPGGASLAVEVKSPQESEERSRGVVGEAVALMDIMTNVLAEPFQQGDVCVRVRFGDELLDASAAAGLIRAALDANHRGAVDLGVFGTAEIRDGRSGRGIEFDGIGKPESAERVALRQRRKLRKALKQVNDADVPGLIVLDVYRDPITHNAREVLRRWAGRKPGVAALVVVDRESYLGRIDGSVAVLPGPEVSKIPDAFWNAFDRCGGGHLHYNPLCSPREPCPLDGWLRYKPPELRGEPGRSADGGAAVGL